MAKLKEPEHCDTLQKVACLECEEIGEKYYRITHFLQTQQ
jgi:hypothetical protein